MNLVPVVQESCIIWITTLSLSTYCIAISSLLLCWLDLPLVGVLPCFIIWLLPSSRAGFPPSRADTRQPGSPLYQTVDPATLSRSAFFYVLFSRRLSALFRVEFSHSRSVFLTVWALIRNLCGCYHNSTLFTHHPQIRRPVLWMYRRCGQSRGCRAVDEWKRRSTWMPSVCAARGAALAR